MKYVLSSVVAALLSSPALAAVGACPISADFITTPETLEATVPIGDIQVQSITQRSFVTGAMVSIECTEVNPDELFPDMSDEDILRNYLRFWSIEPLDDDHGGKGEGPLPIPHVVLTGTKKIQEIEVTYSYRLFRFPSSFALVAIGMPSDTADTSDVERFLSSLQIHELESSPSDPQLFEIVRDGQILDLQRSLEGKQWSVADLSKALVAAAGLNRPAAAELLLKAGADPNYQMLGSSVIVTATRENSVAVLELLLRDGGDPDLKVMSDWSPLHHAILEGGSRYQALEVLIRAGADVDARTSLQITPLHRAAAFCDGRAVEILLAAGADPMLTEKYDRTAYQRSVDADCPGIGGLTPP